MNRNTVTALILFIGTISATGTAFGQAVCQKLDGAWAGTMAGRFAGPVSMAISNCKVTWKLPDGRTNYCSFSENSGKLEYACSLGSQGTVVAQGNRITMRNTFTGNDYTVSVTKR